MPQYELYQKIGLVLFICFGPWLGCQGVHTKIGTEKKFSFPEHFLFQVEDKSTHLILTGGSSQNQKVSFFWDSGSNISFVSDGYLPAHSQKEIWFGKRKEMISNLPALIPEAFSGLLGNDFFRQTCIFWIQTNLYVFSYDSPFCQKPEAYLGTEIKRFETKKFGDYHYIKFRRESTEEKWAVLDTGASVSILPKTKTSRSLGEKKVFQPGGLVSSVFLYESEETLFLAFKSGLWGGYEGLPYLNGISLENLHLPGEKDKGEVWVVGLDVLRLNPLFWDFTRNQIGILSPK
ncbi:hypothetical protein P3G55_09925 [Leptospira sp. 96542]|nr:hypothetical protein [Leptospira sp. 96542]